MPDRTLRRHFSSNAGILGSLTPLTHRHSVQRTGLRSFRLLPGYRMRPLLPTRDRTPPPWRCSRCIGKSTEPPTLGIVQRIRIVGTQRICRRTIRQDFRHRRNRVPDRVRHTLYPIQEWAGYVTEIRKKSFVARLLDRTAGARLPRETAWIPLTEVSRRDAGRMRPGSVFYRVIGYRRDTSGTRQRVSVIVFRDLSVMTAAKLRSARRWARRIRRAFAE